MSSIEDVLHAAVGLAWGPPLVVLLLGGGLVLTVMARLPPLLGLPHALQILRGRFDRSEDPGEIAHFQALSTVLSSTIGLAFALMAVPNKITTLLLAPRLVAATRDHLVRSGIRVPLRARRRV